MVRFADASGWVSLGQPLTQPRKEVLVTIDTVAGDAAVKHWGV